MLKTDSVTLCQADSVTQSDSSDKEMMLTVNLERMYAPAPTPTPITVRKLAEGDSTLARAAQRKQRAPTELKEAFTDILCRCTAETVCLS